MEPYKIDLNLLEMMSILAVFSVAPVQLNEIEKELINKIVKIVKNDPSWDYMKIQLQESDLFKKYFN